MTRKTVDAPANPHNVTLPLCCFRVTTLRFFLNYATSVLVALSDSQFIGRMMPSQQLFPQVFFYAHIISNSNSKIVAGRRTPTESKCTRHAQRRTCGYGLLGYGRRVLPTYNWRGRSMPWPSSCNSSQWLTHPAVRASANTAVNMLVGKPIARSRMPE